MRKDGVVNDPPAYTEPNAVRNREMGKIAMKDANDSE